MTSQPSPSAAPDERQNRGQQNNTVQGSATVSLLAGVIHGDQHFHYQTRYDTPEEKYRVGRNYLEGHVQGPAESLIGAAFMAGKDHRTADVAYHWALAILSGRTFDQLDQSDLAKLSTAFELTGEPAPGHRGEALAVVSRLIEHLVKQTSPAGHEGAEFVQVLTDFEALPAERRDEIRRHLEMILDGGIQDHLDAQYASELSTRRMSGNRRERAWKFFDPDPTPPVLRQPEPVRIAVGEQARLVAGVLVSICGFAMLIPLLAGATPGLAPGTLIICFAGGGYALTHWWQQSRRRSRRQAIRALHSSVTGKDRPPTSRERDFATQVKRTLDVEFDYFKIHHVGRSYWKRWGKDVQGIRNAIYREIVGTYRERASIEQVRWLIRWHARRTFASWKSGTLPDPFDGLRDRPASVRHITLGLVVTTVCGCLWVILTLGVNWPMALLSNILLGAGGLLLFPPTTRLFLKRSRYAAEIADAALRYREHSVAYRTVRRALVDRPDDSEMARWLDHDKAHVKLLAMEHYQLTNRSVFAHAVISQAAPHSRAARVSEGPPRYSANRVLIFLFTDGGVCQVTVELNFLTGDIYNEERVTFNYEAITSAWFNEIELRLDGEQNDPDDDGVGRQDDTPDHSTGDEPAGTTTTLVVSRTFSLSLENSEKIIFGVQNFYRGVVDRSRDVQRNMLQLALDVAGVTGALWLLEVVAAEGKDWISREKQRRARRLRQYHHPDGARFEPVDPASTMDRRQEATSAA